MPEGAEPFAQAYAGHQFGHFTMLGDGRAVLIGEHLSKKKDMYDKTVRSGNFTNRNKLPKTIELWKKNFLIVGFQKFY